MTRCVVVGGGAHEHALAWGLSRHAEVVVTPGNAGIAAHGIACTPAPATELAADLVVIGPEQPLVEGLADELRARGVAVVGPGAAGARLEGSKAYLKEFLVAAGVPTAAHGTFHDLASASAHLRASAPPYVIKTDGLAAGKGVLVTDDLAVALDDVRAKLSGSAFGAAGSTVVIEEGLLGEECSLHFLCAGGRARLLAPAQDFKRVGDGDLGPNTGGMGAYAPMTSLSADQLAEARELIIEPTLAELARRGIDYRGVLYAGVMLTTSGVRLLEYNVRFGDPEAEVLVATVDGDLVELLSGVAQGHVVSGTAHAAGHAVTVVLAAHGYPGTPRLGDVIAGLGRDGQLASPIDGVVVFHAGTRRRADGSFVTAGGRVLAVTGSGPTLEEARRRAYAGAAAISFSGRVSRDDIAARVAS